MSEEIIRITNLLTNTPAPDVKMRLMPLINDLINHDFDALIQILYRIDVNEAKLKSVLRENPGQDAASLLADAIIDRQLEKIRLREKSHRSQKNDDENSW